MCRILKVPAPDLESSAAYVLIRGMLLEFQKIGDDRNWDEYRKKLKNQDMLAGWTEIMGECVRNGFMAPYVNGNKIVWRQIRTNGKYHSLDLCTCCERDCIVREDIETGKDKWKRQNLSGNHKEREKCWEVGAG